jgi:hypothetical protein
MHPPSPVVQSPQDALQELFVIWQFFFWFINPRSRIGKTISELPVQGCALELMIDVFDFFDGDFLSGERSIFDKIL